MTPDQLTELKNNPILLGRLAKKIVHDCFRNSTLEDLHAGKSPSSETGDYSDVKVVSPYGEIPWKRLSRLNDAEMKALMIEVVDQCYDFLTELCQPGGADTIAGLMQRDEVPQWYDPHSATL